MIVMQKEDFYIRGELDKMNLVIRMKKKPLFFTLLILILGCFLSGCSSIELGEQEQKELELDTEYALVEAQKYLWEKYHMDLEVSSFEPYIYCRTSDANWFTKTHYDRTWVGEFLVEGKVYEIKANFATDKFEDSYQYDKIRVAYEGLAQQYFEDVWEEKGVEYEIVVLFKETMYGDKNDIRLFNTYYDESNIYDILKENGMGIYIYTDAELGQAFWDKVEMDVANLRNDFPGVKFMIFENEDYLSGI